MKTKSGFVSFLLVGAIVCSAFSGCGSERGSINNTDYSNEYNWAYYEDDKTDTKADVFFICPAVYRGDEKNVNMSLSDEEARAAFLGATNMEKGIYDTESRFFAPYYRQVGLDSYKHDYAEQEKYLRIAYSDVKASFEYYLENENKGNPIILAGFSLGADMCIRLLKDCFKDDETNKLLVACYAIGWRITEKEIAEYPHIQFASGESDTGVVISFNSEEESVSDSLIIPSGTKTLAINPLNWKTDGTPAEKSVNMGACFTDYDGNINSEIPELCGCYIDEERGALKVTDILSADYPPVIDLFDEGVFHLYDYQFFYRNLQKNVQTRLDAYLTK